MQFISLVTLGLRKIFMSILFIPVLKMNNLVHHVMNIFCHSLWLTSHGSLKTKQPPLPVYNIDNAMIK